MRRYQFVLALVVMCLVVMYVAEDSGPQMRLQSYDPLEGNLLHQDLPQGVIVDKPLPRPETYLPHIAVYIDDPSAAGLKPTDGAFIGDISSSQNERLKILTHSTKTPLTTTEEQHSRPEKEHLKTHITRSAQTTENALTSSTTTAVSRVIRQDTFSTMNDTLENNLLSFPLDNRIQHGNVVVQLEQLGKVDSYYLLKFSVANNEADEFFMSKGLILANKVPVPSKEFMPFSCRPDEVVYGIVQFPVSDVAGKKVTFVLTESGSGARHYELKNINFAF